MTIIVLEKIQTTYNQLTKINKMITYYFKKKKTNKTNKKNENPQIQV